MIVPIDTSNKGAINLLTLSRQDGFDGVHDVLVWQVETFGIVHFVMFSGGRLFQIEEIVLWMVVMLLDEVDSYYDKGW